MVQTPNSNGPLVVLGALGLLGSHLVKYTRSKGLAVVGLDRSMLDITILNNVQQVLRKLRPSAIINPAAFTSVDGAEDTPELARLTNTTGAANVAQVAAELGAYLIHYSTDFVFADDAPHARTEEEPVSPRGVYASSKADGEQRVLALNPDAAVARVGNIYGTGGKNFVSQIHSLLLNRAPIHLDGERLISPTSAKSISETTIGLLTLRPSGRIHMTCSGSTTWYKFGTLMAKTLNISDPEIVCVSCAALSLPAYRPSVVLNGKRLAELGLAMPDWRKALKEYLASTNTKLEK